MVAKKHPLNTKSMMSRLYQSYIHLYRTFLAWYTKLIDVQIFVHIYKSLSASEFSIHLWFTLHWLCLRQLSRYGLSVVVTLSTHMLSTISSIVDPQPQGTSLYFGAGMCQMLGPIFRRNHGSGTLDFDELHGIMGISFTQINYYSPFIFLQNDKKWP